MRETRKPGGGGPRKTPRGGGPRREFGECRDPPAPYNRFIISDNRPIPALPQGHFGFLEQKLDLLFFRLTHSTVPVTWSPVTQLQTGEDAISRDEALPV